jgi:2-polyprenyl-6-methoxyphenol hydroxylase-like FAD-dependent oxidoreductase
MKPVTIVGGGLAGLTLGLQLRQKGVPVQIHDAGSYPRHRVCGEYLSGRALSIIESLGLRPGLDRLGAVESSDVLLSLGSSVLSRRILPQPALCLSRYEFDRFLVQELIKAGGDIQTAHRIPSQHAEGTVLATGRQPSATQHGWRWFGLKAHARNVSLEAGLEMHLSSRGYIGLCRIENNQVNVCGLFRSRSPVPDLASSWKNWLGGDSDSLLQQRICHAEWDESSFSSIAALSLSPQRASVRAGLRIGDALTMIPPVTGNGMSMAIEGADLATNPLVDWSSQKLDWDSAVKKVATQLDTAFAPRLRHARWLQHAMFDPIARSVAWNLSRIFPDFPSLLFRLTR